MSRGIIGKNIKAIREANGLTQSEFAEEIGVTLISVSKWETQGIQPRDVAIRAIIERFGVSHDDVLSETNGYYAKTLGIAKEYIPTASSFTLPLAGCTTAGEPGLAYELTGEKVYVPPQYAKEGNFVVEVRGDSMNRVIPDGSLAIIKKGEVHSGNIALVKVNGDEATIKRVKLTEGLIILEPESTNSEHKRRVIDSSDPDSPEVRLLGQVVHISKEI